MLINIVSMVWLYMYLNKYVYKAINPENLSEANINAFQQDINIKDIDEILNNLEKKIIRRSYNGISNIFY